jgi:hypothetical protein
MNEKDSGNPALGNPEFCYALRKPARKQKHPDRMGSITAYVPQI